MSQLASLETFDADILGEILNQLTSANAKTLQKISSSKVTSDQIEWRSLQCHSDVVNVIFYLIDLWRQSDRVKFLAVELCDKILPKLVRQTRQSFLTVTEQTDEDYDWRETGDRLNDQLMMRIATVIGIASKLHDVEQFRMDRVIECLRQLGHDYDSSTMLKSELRMMKLVKFKLDLPTLFDYVQLLLAVIYNNLSDKCQFDYDTYLRLSIKMLSMFYLKRHDIITVFSTIQTSRRQDDSFDWDLIAFDKILIAASVITAVSAVFDLGNKELVTNELVRITKTKADDILDMQLSLLGVVYETGILTGS